MTDQPPVLIENLSFSYDGPTVLENVNLTVRDGEFLCMVGPNGGGKTTLLRLILGLLRPQAGRVRVYGASPEAARPRLGYMPQQADLDAKFPASAFDVVLMGRLRSGFGLGPYGARDREVARRALGDVGLRDAERRPFAALSGGQRQRVLLARALACEPGLLLLDEPTASVDMVAEEELFEVLGRLNERMTIVVVTHDVGFVSGLVESVICVNHRVVVHPTSELDGTVIAELYGRDVRMVRHDHRCSEDGHEWPTS